MKRKRTRNINGKGKEPKRGKKETEKEHEKEMKRNMKHKTSLDL